MAKHSEETVYRFWNDDTGEYIQVGEDSDGLNMVEVRSYASNGCVAQSIVLTEEQAEWLRTRLAKCLFDIRQKKNDSSPKIGDKVEIVRGKGAVVFPAG